MMIGPDLFMLIVWSLAVLMYISYIIIKAILTCPATIPFVCHRREGPKNAANCPHLQYVLPDTLESKSDRVKDLYNIYYPHSD